MTRAQLVSKSLVTGPLTAGRRSTPPRRMTAVTFIVFVAMTTWTDASSTTTTTRQFHRVTAVARQPFLVQIRGGSTQDEVVRETESESLSGGVPSDQLEESSLEIDHKISENNSDASETALDDLLDASPSKSANGAIETTTSDELEGKQTDTEEVELNSVVESMEPLSREEIDIAVNEAGKLRTEGKELHDEAQFAQAAAKFSSAANHLYKVLPFDGSVVDDFAACRLHEALCFLKAEEFSETVRACSDVLDLPAQSVDESATTVEPALRARAFHRRAKAQLELGNEEAALEDARSAAFLGDRRAVALYGKLMRGNSSSSLMNNENGDSLAASSALFESLLNKSRETSSSLDSLGDIGSSFPASLLMGAGANGGVGDGAGSLAKSVLSSLSKRLHEESTQDQICTYLQSTSGPQLQQMAGLAGIQLADSQANRLASFCQGVTPKTIKRTLRTTKVVYSLFRLIRSISQVISKYRSLIILFLIAGWIKSAIFRPLPVSKKAARLAAKAAADTVKNAM